ncbi:MAG TPA: hypothetical protein VG346_04405 [Acidimicrobiales bacterium]|jgi:hypothetical protein|nr:hypothetical protein [Acidimicrobiales bacterium]
MAVRTTTSQRVGGGTEHPTPAVIDRRRFLFLVGETPTFALEVMTDMAEHLRHAH